MLTQPGVPLFIKIPGVLELPLKGSSSGFNQQRGAGSLPAAGKVTIVYVWSIFDQNIIMKSGLHFLFWRILKNFPEDLRTKIKQLKSCVPKYFVFSLELKDPYKSCE